MVSQTKQLPQKKMEHIDSSTMKQMVIAATCWLNEHQAEVDALNVFPVPDGDTGTNMYLTLLDAAKEVEKAEEGQVTNVIEALALGALMGARGNSGVILSQLFRGFADGVKGLEVLSPQDLARGFQNSSARAYKAVMKPVEGTILTVARKAGEAALEAAESGTDIIGVLEATLVQANKTLAKTPEMLPVLKEANVVDAGGKGYCFILEGYLRALKGDIGNVSELIVLPEEKAGGAIKRTKLEYLYCTEFLLKGKGANIDKIRKDLEKYGDSLLVVGSTDVIKIHIHTNNPGSVLEYALRYGKLSKIDIDNMEEQGHGEHNHDVFPAATPLAPDNVGFGIVAVVAGDGLSDIFMSMGVEKIVNGGQSMNPSTNELVEACNGIAADKVIILPNNKNVVFTAEQVKEVCDKDVHVLPSKSIPQGVAAMMRVNPEMEFDKMRQEMAESLKDIKGGEVTFAVRDSKINSMDIKEGDIIGLYNGKIMNSAADIDQVSLDLLSFMVDKDDFLITIYKGSDVTEEDGEKLKNKVSEKFDHCDVELYPGGQPIYYYIFSVE